MNVQILLTNDDGIYAPGLAAMERALQAAGRRDGRRAGDRAERRRPFDHVSLAADGRRGVRRRTAARLGGRGEPGRLREAGRGASSARRRPDLIVSGINGGFNVGINVLYSGTVAGATEGALFGIPSVAVSLEWDEQPKFDEAAELASD